MHFKGRHPRSERVRKIIGIVLSALVVLGHLSPPAAFLRDLPNTMTLALGQEIVVDGGYTIGYPRPALRIRAPGMTSGQGPPSRRCGSVCGT